MIAYLERFLDAVQSTTDTADERRAHFDTVPSMTQIETLFWHN